MTPDSVSSRGRNARSDRPAGGSRTAACLLAAAGLLVPAAAGLRAQTPGTLDTSFNSGGLGSTVYAIDYETDADGSPKITIGGDRTLGAYVSTSGAASTTFFFPDFGNAARIVYTIVPEQVLPDGQSLHNLLFGGNFGRGLGQLSAGIASQNIIRVLPSGALDTTFQTNVGTGANNFVTSILPLADGRIVVGGQFTLFNKESRRRIVRLLNTGAIDESFATGSNIDNDVITLAESIAQDSGGQTDGSTLVGGIFNHVAGQPYGKLCRLDPNGNLDMTFHPVIDLRVLSILVQPNGKIIIGGDFTNVNGVPVSRIARLNYDGSLDTTFTASVTGVPNKDVNPTAVYVLKPVPDSSDGKSDGRIYIGGEFAQINGTPRVYLGLISADGVLDTSFDPGSAIYDSVQTIAVETDAGNENKILVGETLGPKIGKTVQPSFVRLFGVTPGSNQVGTVTQQHAQPEVPKKAVNAPAGTVPGRTSSRLSHVYMW